MPGRITELTALSGAAAATDLIEVVDVSDTSMAATGTNKKITVADLTSAAGGYAGNSIPLGMGPTPYTPAMSFQLVAAGLPGRHIQNEWIDANKRTMHVGYRYLNPIYVAEATLQLNAYAVSVITTGAGAVMDFGIYSVPDWRFNRTATVVAGTKVTGADVATAGSKVLTFGPTTLTRGCYWVAHLLTGIAGTGSFDYMIDAGCAYNADLLLGNNGNFAVYRDVSGQTSLPDSFTVDAWGGHGNSLFCTLYTSATP